MLCGREFIKEPIPHGCTIEKPAKPVPGFNPKKPFGEIKMSDKPKLEVVAQVDEDKVLQDKLKDPEFKKKYDEALEESKNFDLDERAAYLMETVYPGQLMGALKALAKNKPNALARVMYNEILHPFHMVDYLTKEEKELSKMINEILMAKRQIFDYTEKSKEERAAKKKALAEQENKEE